MGQFDNWDDDSDFGGSENGKGLRKQLEAALSKLNEAAELNAKLQEQIRTRNVQDTLKGLNLPTKIAKLIPKDIADDVEKVTSWVKEYSDVFAVPQTPGDQALGTDQSAAPEEPQTPNIDAGIQAAMERINTDSDAGATTTDIEAAQLAQLEAMRAAAGGSADKFFALMRGDIQM